MMNKRIWIALLIGLMSAWTWADAQADYDEDKGIHVGVGVGVSFPQGFQASAGLRFSPLLSLRGGVGYLPQIQVYTDDMALTGVSGLETLLGYRPNLNLKGKVGSLTGHLLLDIHPFQNGFRLTAGIYLGAPAVSAHGVLINPQTKRPIVEDPAVTEVLNRDKMPRLTLANQDKPEEKVVIQPSRDGEIDAKLSLGKVLQPYLGIGYGYAVPKSRVSFMLDFGVLYGGKLQLSSPNIIEGDPNFLFRLHENSIKIRQYSSFIPLLNLGISVRLF